VYESRHDRRALARDAGLGRISVVSLLSGVAAAVGAFAVLIGLASAATSAVNFDTDLMSYEWPNVDPPDAAIFSLALFLAWLLGGYTASRMARRAGASHGLYTWALGAVLLVVAVAAVNELGRSGAVVTGFRALGIPTAVDDWRGVSGVVGIAWALTALAGSAFGGALGERWHTRLMERAADPGVGPDAEARVAAGERLVGDTGMVDVRERLGALVPPPASAAETFDDEREWVPSV
jgi:hypothetical protein